MNSSKGYSDPHPGDTYIRRTSSELSTRVQASQNLGKRRATVGYECGLSDDETDVDNSIPSMEQENDESDLIPPHLIDVVAERLLFKRPRSISNLGSVEPLGSRNIPYQDCLQTKPTFDNQSVTGSLTNADGYLADMKIDRCVKAEYSREADSRRSQSPYNSFLAVPSMLESASTLPAWLLKEAEAAAVAAAAADRRVARYLGLLGAAVGADIAGARGWAEHSDAILDPAFSFSRGESVFRKSRTELGCEDYRINLGKDLRFTGAQMNFGPDRAADIESFAHGQQGLGPRATSVKRADFESRDHVYEISSEGGSCQPSPEGPILSLCGDLSEDEVTGSLTPLDLGNPAIDPASARHTPRTMIPEAATVEMDDFYTAASVLDLGGEHHSHSTSFPEKSLDAEYKTHSESLSKTLLDGSEVPASADLHCLFGTGGLEFSPEVDGVHWMYANAGCAVKTGRGDESGGGGDDCGGRCLRSNIGEATWDPLHAHTADDDDARWW